MTKEGMRAKIITRLKVCNVDLSPAIETLMNECLEAFCQGIIDEIAANQTMTVIDGDFNLLPGPGATGFKDSTVTLITGEGENKAFALTGKMS